MVVSDGYHSRCHCAAVNCVFYHYAYFPGRHWFHHSTHFPTSFEPFAIEMVADLSSFPAPNYPIESMLVKYAPLLLLEYNVSGDWAMAEL